MTEYLEECAAKYPDLASSYTNFSTLYTQKLWHELTLSLLSFMSDPSNMREGNLNFVSLYNSFVMLFDGKLNQLSLAKIAMKVAESYADDDLQSRQSMIEGLLEKRARLGAQAGLYLDMGHGMTSILRGLDLPSVKKSLASAKLVLDSLEGSNDPSCHAAYYRTASAYHKVEGPPEAFYSNAIMYLNYAPPSSMSSEEQVQWATDVSLAALTGEGVFNFGEVAQLPVLQCLQGTSNQWLMDLMVHFSTGDVNGFNATMSASSASIQSQPALFPRLEHVSEKIKLLALVNMVFERPANDRNVTFAEISARAQVEPSQVEWLVMRSLSLGLLRATIDQPAQTVNVTWVMRRVLSPEQVKDLADRLGEWAEKVTEMQHFVSDNSVELLYS
mmetsp:Transcript_12776/g.25411  ORF Transcript_12776/g.25411 Transcript_12776/m.25411 type:complete len:387 (+) Transcript_12776:189-1349(+)|eukprot:CAMPEP_0182458690 /NCGR_PEP_ID=MMETSP1319-20130603/3973_1 /TAXON_ID=172717 /ORGANISM="Bolidomonas pacifica, Strain RCC208" /LENGTH=386 /DNA_ID=CAMNT_0024657427 /DNA_START=306 /DNA_END=1466 /DNA_ORIENTATION=+